ncbi:MAG: helix-turn-helix transcriptional regulator [Selenomonadaceae bacterium]|nr:helix-turn-helix transcriptional regulator [Selenomonadaceae bacterium]MBQ3433720.1 helix-turn-helix transcriptional regulator [Selenomonadaceae bacterium]
MFKLNTPLIRKLILKDRGLSTTQVAAQANISVETARKIIAGQDKASYLTVGKLAKLFDTEIEDLIIAADK